MNGSREAIRSPAQVRESAADPNVVQDPWEALREHTQARIALGRCGAAPPLHETLAFRLAHARARDAVHSEFRQEELADEIAAFHPVIRLRSEAADRLDYLTRPDKGRRLHAESTQLLAAQDVPMDGYDLCLVVGDGLSSKAIHQNAPDFLRRFIGLARQIPLRVAPVCVVANARVAVADPIGEALKAAVVAILIGERPGLSSPNSMGIYMTWEPRSGKTDEARNCISNIRPGGLSIEAGVRKLSYLVEQARALKFSGVRLKDQMPRDYLPFINTPMLGA